MEKNTGMYRNDLLLRCIRRETVERPPVWLMRQAGRILPQYRELRKEVGSFKKLIQSPELVAEVTYMPVEELGVDAAILFSDILVIPGAMGLEYEFVKGKGPVIEQVIKNKSDIEQCISDTEVLDDLQFVFDGIVKTVKRLDFELPLIGFSGAPWTLFCYMIEGEGSKTFSKARRFLQSHPIESHLLLKKITDSVIAYLNQQVKAGVDIVQVFDSWVGLLNPRDFKAYCIPYLMRIREEVNAEVIYFPKGATYALEELKRIAFTGLSIDWGCDMAQARKRVGQNQVLQGNIDPAILYAHPDKIKAIVEECISEADGRHIVNLGHGVYPDTPLEGVKCMIECVKEHNNLSIAQ